MCQKLEPAFDKWINRNFSKRSQERIYYGIWTINIIGIVFVALLFGGFFQSNQVTSDWAFHDHFKNRNLGYVSDYDAPSWEEIDKYIDSSLSYLKKMNASRFEMINKSDHLEVILGAAETLIIDMEQDKRPPCLFYEEDKKEGCDRLSHNKKDALHDWALLAFCLHPGNRFYKTSLVGYKLWTFPPLETLHKMQDNPPSSYRIALDVIRKASPQMQAISPLAALEMMTIDGVAIAADHTLSKIIAQGDLKWG
jgi:hypothetical protein